MYDKNREDLMKRISHNFYLISVVIITLWAINKKCIPYFKLYQQNWVLHNCEINVIYEIVNTLNIFETKSQLIINHVNSLFLLHACSIYPISFHCDI